jgi:hypothetical protein
MAKDRERLVFECPDRVKKAIRMRAALDGLKPSGVILAALLKYLDSELGFVDQRSSQETEGAPVTRRAKGRP